MAPLTATTSARDGSVFNNVFRGGGGGDHAGLRAANHIGSVVDDWPMYSSQPEDYILQDVIGLGASSVVHQASFLPLDGRACAVKVIDLEAFGRDTEELRRETQLMSLSKHPNVLRVRGCWVQGTKLHIATRLMSSGSLLDIMRYSYADGFPEEVICTVLKQALQGLSYLHVNGWLHRDLKAANLLVDDDGTVLLGDFGVGVWIGDGNQSVNGKRKSFVGTPCWMAPEVVERKLYNAKADIWSFGITALELSQGRAPHSRLAPVKVLMKTLQEGPPTLDRRGGAHKYSRAFEEFVGLCLQKDPEKRPTADKLLKHAFFKAAKSPRYLATTMLSQLPPLSERQERQRAMSIASARNQQSWDFGASPPASVGRSGSTPRTPLSPSGSGFLPLQRESHTSNDPFAGFTASIASPGPSPWNSMRGRPAAAGVPSFGATIMSFDGEHVLAVEEEAEAEQTEADDTQGSATPAQHHLNEGVFAADQPSLASVMRRFDRSMGLDGGYDEGTSSGGKTPRDRDIRDASPPAASTSPSDGTDSGSKSGSARALASPSSSRAEDAVTAIGRLNIAFHFCPRRAGSLTARHLASEGLLSPISVSAPSSLLTVTSMAPNFLPSMVSDFFYPNVGGVEGHIYAVSKELVARGHRVVVITHSYAKEGAPAGHRVGVRQLSCGITVYHLPLATLASQATLPNFFTSHPLLRYILVREQIDIVHVHASLSSLAHEALFHARALCATGGKTGNAIRTVFTDHSLFSLGEDSASALTNKLLGFVLSDVDRVVTVSYTGKDNTILRAQIDPNRVHVIPNAVDSTHFHPPQGLTTRAADHNGTASDRITVVILSRLTYRKGISLLLDVIPLICESCPDVDFLIGGDGPKRVDLEQMREGTRPILLDRVTLVGQVTGAEAVRDHLHSGQIFLSPSLTEAFGTTLIEAASCGLLCVATRVGGVPETLPQPQSLMLAEPTSRDIVRVLKGAVERIREERSQARESPEAQDVNDPRSLAATFRGIYSWSHVARRLEQVYSEALHERTPSTFERMQKYFYGNKSLHTPGGERGTAAGIVFCIVVATNLAFAALLEYFWPADDIERAIWWLEEDPKTR